MPGRRWAWCVRPVRLDAKDNIAVTIEGSRSSFNHHTFSSLWHHWAILVRGPIRAHPGMHRRSSRRACSRRRTAVAPDGRSLSEGGTAHELSREEAQEEDAEAQAPQNAEEDALATQAQGLTALPPAESQPIENPAPVRCWVLSRSPPRRAAHVGRRQSPPENKSLYRAAPFDCTRVASAAPRRTCTPYRRGADPPPPCSTVPA